MPVERASLDTSVLIYATLSEDPRSERYGITRQRYFDMQLAATMIVNGIDTLLTENVRDFQIIQEIHTVNPFL